MKRIIRVAVFISGLVPSMARAQFAVDWYSVDCGGGTAAGGTFAVTGTIGQPDAGAPHAGGTFEVTAGFLVPSDSCYANCDQSTAAPILNVNDFQCFIIKYAAGDSYANCDQSTSAPMLNINDFQCFANRFAAGCP